MWGQQKDGTIVYLLLEDLDRRATTLLDAEVDRLTVFVGDARVTPRFRTPAERALVG